MPFIKRDPPEWTVLLEIQAAARPGLHVTDLLSCPRRKRYAQEGTQANLKKLEARLTGILLHREMATVNPESAEVEVGGTMFGLFVIGSIDRLTDDGFTVDYKAGEDKGANRKLPDAPYPEEVFQQEAYRFLLDRVGRKTFGWRIYYRWQKEWWMYEHVGPLWDEKMLAAFHPHGGAFSTKQIADLHMTPGKAVSLPLVGETMKIGKENACFYCEYEKPCKSAGAEIEL